jgi:transposase
VRQLKQKPKVFIPLEFDPGEAAQVDWGNAIAYIKGQRTVVQLFCMRLCNSAAIFVAAFPTQRYESFLMGNRLALEFFGGVPRRLIYDNVKTAVKEGWGKHVTQEQLPFKHLKAHYAFTSTFCNPGQETKRAWWRTW